MAQHIVYRRTQAGMDAMRKSDLPRQLRTLLMLIDGRSDVTTYARSLSNFGDVPALLEALHAEGYITASPPPASPTARLAVTTPERRPAVVQQEPSRPSAGWAGPTTQPPPSSMQGLSGWDPYRSTLTGPGTHGGLAAHEASRVQKARSLMTDYLLQHHAGIALEAILDLERLETTEQILRSLDRYARLISADGRRALEHMDRLRTVLRD